jgi:phage major head subunit gpT-like protein
MAADITTSTLVHAVTKGYDKMFTDKWDRLPKQYTAISKSISMNNKTWLSYGFNGVGAMTTFSEGSAPSADDITEEYGMTLTATNYGKKWLITMNMIRDDQYDILNSIPGSAANSANEAREVAVANLFNNAFSTTGYDSVCLCSASHPLTSGSTQSNVLANPATLEKQSLRDMIIQMRGLTDQKGLIISRKPKTLLVPTELMFDAEELIMSPRDSETDRNAVTPKAQAGLLREVNDRLTDADAFYLVSEVENIYFGLRDEVSKEVNPQVDGSRNIIYDVQQRFAVGWSNYRDVIGTPGVS